MTESPLLRHVRVALAKLGLTMFRNNVGAAWMGDALYTNGRRVVIENARRVVFGLFKGSSDLIGWRTLTITQDMVGKRVAQFVALETKSKRGRLTVEQRQFIEAVRNAGGIAGHARTVEEAEKLILEGQCPSTSQPSTQRRSRTSRSGCQVAGTTGESTSR